MHGQHSFGKEFYCTMSWRLIYTLTARCPGGNSLHDVLSFDNVMSKERLLATVRGRGADEHRTSSIED